MSFLTFLVQNAVPAVLIIAYLYYEVHWGKGAQIEDHVEGVVTVVIALAEENPNINEENVADRFNGDRPSQFKDDEEYRSDEETKYKSVVERVDGTD